MRNNTKRNSSIIALLVFLPMVVVLYLAYVDWSNEREIAQRAQATIGRFTGIEKLNHGQIDYEYVVDGVIYTGGEIVEHSSIIGPLRVEYDPLNPKVSTITHFGEIGTRPVPVVLCFVLSLVFYFRLRAYLIRRSELEEDARETKR
ncbi:MAG: hypothetical protein JSS87_01085 [Acidobacteria bacterium]|nr:hypothetical protein [Acidobacteriota bacterium]